MSNITVATLDVNVRARVDQYMKEMDKTKKKNKEFASSCEKSNGKAGKSWGKLKGVIAAVKTFIAFQMTKAVANFAAQTAQEIDKLAKTARGLEVDFQFMQKMQFVTRNAGVEFGVLETALRNASRRVGEMNLGIGNAGKNFARLGMSSESFFGLNPQEQFLKIMKAINSIQDPNERIAISMSLFEEMGPKVVQLARGVGEYGKAWDKLGHNLTDDQAEQMKRLNEQVERTNSAFKRLKVTVAASYGAPMWDHLERISKIGTATVQYWSGGGNMYLDPKRGSNLAPKGTWGANLKADSPWEQRAKQEAVKKQRIDAGRQREALEKAKFERQAQSFRDAKEKRDTWGDDGPWQVRIRQEEEKLAVMKKQLEGFDMLPGAYEKGSAATISLLNNMSSANQMAEERKFRKDSIKVQQEQLKELKKRAKDEEWLESEQDRIAKIL